MSASYKRLRKFLEIRSANYRSRPGVIEHVHEWIGPDAIQHDLTEHDLEQLLAEHSAALDELKQLRAEREGALVWNEWCVRILIGGGAVSMDYEDETEARIRYRELLDHPEKVRRLVYDATSYPGEIGAVELLCRTNWQGDYRVVEAAPQQPVPDGGAA